MNVIKHLDDIITHLKQGKLLEAESLERYLIAALRNTTNPSCKLVLSVLQKDYLSAQEKSAEYTVLLRELNGMWGPR
jgi:hypothetical protein